MLALHTMSYMEDSKDNISVCIVRQQWLARHLEHA